MIINVVATEAVRVLSKSETPWNMEGRSGITYKLGIRCGGDIDKIKVSADVYNRVELDKDYLLSGQVSANNGRQGIIFDKCMVPTASARPGVNPGK